MALEKLESCEAPASLVEGTRGVRPPRFSPTGREAGGGGSAFSHLPFVILFCLKIALHRC